MQLFTNIITTTIIPVPPQVALGPVDALTNKHRNQKKARTHPVRAFFVGLFLDLLADQFAGNTGR
jgi:hypothetical protein